MFASEGHPARQRTALTDYKFRAIIDLNRRRRVFVLYNACLMAWWMSVEIFDGAFPARVWADAHQDSLAETALTNGALDWEIKRTGDSVVFEVAFATEAQWLAFRQLEPVQNALRTAPDPLAGVIIYRGRSTDLGTLAPRKPKPRIGTGSGALTLPIDVMPFLEPLPAYFTSDTADRRRLTTTH